MTFLCFFMDLAGLSAGAAASAATAENVTAANRAAITAAIIFFMLVFSICKFLQGMTQTRCHTLNAALPAWLTYFVTS